MDDKDEIVSSVVLAEIIGYIHIEIGLRSTGESNSLIESIHSTRLTEKILEHIWEFGEHKRAKHGLLTFKEDLVQAMHTDLCRPTLKRKRNTISFVSRFAVALEDKG